MEPIDPALRRQEDTGLRTDLRLRLLDVVLRAGSALPAHGVLEGRADAWEAIELELDFQRI